jgi:hypothetical protein
MASAVADRPAWQRYFRVLIGLKDNDTRLRSGMSVMTQILSCQREQALLIPRLAVRREGDAVYVWVDQKGRRERRPVVLGWANLHQLRSDRRPGSR